MIVITLLILLFLIVTADFYIWSGYIKGSGLLLSTLHFLPTVLMLALLTVAVLRLAWTSHNVVRIQTVAFAIFMCVCVPKIIFTALSLIGRLTALALPASAGIFNVLGLCAAAVFIAGSAYGILEGWRHYVVNERELAFSDLPEAFDGYRIAQISDLHIGTCQHTPKTVEKLVDMVNSQNPDIILFTGDIVNLRPSELDGMTEILSRLRAADGVISIMGNHDYCLYARFKTPKQRNAAISEVQEREKSMGWKLLLNEHTVLHREADSLAIIGVENDGEPPFPQLGDLPKAMKGLKDGIFKILMTHDPTHWRRNVLPETDIQLTLSGHTHAAQLRIGNFSPSKWKYPEWGGIYREGRRILHVSVGTGGNFAFRFGAWPEIDILTLRKGLIQATAR